MSIDKYWYLICTYKIPLSPEKDSETIENPVRILLNSKDENRAILEASILWENIKNNQGENSIIKLLNKNQMIINCEIILKD